MADTLASFRDLAGLGPACEARLHAAGVHSWRALDEVLDAVGHLRNDGKVGRHVFALADLDAGIPESAGHPVDSSERRTVQHKEMGHAETKRSLGIIDVISNDIHRGVILPQAIFGLLTR